MTCLTIGIDAGSECHLRHANETSVAAAGGADSIGVEKVEEKEIALEKMQQSSSQTLRDEEQCLRKFARYCLSFYDSSLVLPSASSRTSSSSLCEEKKVEDQPNSATQARRGKLILETLDRISSIRSIVDTQNQQQPQEDHCKELLQSIANLNKDHALAKEQHGELLVECGLHDVGQFINKSPLLRQSDDDSNATILFQKYTRMRDAMRRRSHRLAMMQRQSSLFELLTHSEQEKRDHSTTVSATIQTENPITAASNDKAVSNSKPQMTQLQHIQNSLSIIQLFVKKYQSNIGSHSFLAGLHKLVQLQLNPTSQLSNKKNGNDCVVRWKFRGSVLTEACHSGSCNKEDALAYARDAAHVLFSFLVWNKDIDVEGGGLQSGLKNCNEEPDLDWDQIMDPSAIESPEEKMEPFLSFEINKYLSNANLRKILAVLPNPKVLDARATGSVEILNASSQNFSIASTADNSSEKILPRLNSDGHLDEPWPWFASWQFCNVL